MEYHSASSGAAARVRLLWRQRVRQLPLATAAAAPVATTCCRRKGIRAGTGTEGCEEEMSLGHRVLGSAVSLPIKRRGLHRGLYLYCHQMISQTLPRGNRRDSGRHGWVGRQKNCLRKRVRKQKLTRGSN